MNPVIKTLAVALLLAAAIGGGYLLGVRHAADGGTGVHAGHAPEPVPAASQQKKILYYRNPMGLPDTSPVPKKDPMGMDYIPVYEGENEDAPGSGLSISIERVQRLGVRTETAALRTLTRTVRAVGTLQIDERRISTVSPKFEGWIERLHVNTTGQAVARGEPLMEVYSPELVTAQQEYLIASRGIDAVSNGSPELQLSMRELTAGALARLANWDISPLELERLQREGTIRRTVTLRSPAAGVIVEKPALRGMRFMPGEALFQIADLSSLWLLAEIFEQDLGLVRPGQHAKIEVNAFPGRTFNGKVSFFYPTVNAETRTGRVRIELTNPGGLLKPAMYATVELAAGPRKPVLAVPASAVIDSGVRRVAIVRLAEGRFEPRTVRTGASADDYIEILEGIKAGEDVVVAANFLIDAESNLRAAVSGLTAPPAAIAQPKPASVAHRAEGTVESIDPKAGTAMISHAPVATLQWPAMTMEFQLANPSLAARMKPGAAIAFEFVERKPGEWVVTAAEPRAAAKPRPEK
jgi:RND family efflux transporter MFP subunit